MDNKNGKLGFIGFELAGLEFCRFFMNLYPYSLVSPHSNPLEGGG
jgi:hypothetical protein